MGMENKGMRWPDFSLRCYLPLIVCWMCLCDQSVFSTSFRKKWHLIRLKIEQD